MNTLSGGLVTAVAPVVIQVRFTTKMMQTDMAISGDIARIAIAVHSLIVNH